MRLDVKRQLFARSERVKGIDFHPTEPWILNTLYSGHAQIWNYETQALVKSFELTDVPIRAGRFIARKNWICCGSDDFQLRVYNYNTSEKVTSFEAHPDYIRAIVVHPTQPFVLTASDDMTIRLWNWDAGWKLMQTFEGHAHYVMGLAINPKDTNTFASACLDRTIKIWSFGSGSARQTIDAHETKGVNFVDYYPGQDKPYLLSTSDDRTVKVWDYTNKSLVATLEGHTSNVSFAVYHPELPIIISGSEDGTIKIWHANTYKLEQSLSYGLERAWCVAYQRSKNGVALGFDDGAVVISMGREVPCVSMDSAGKIIYSRNNEILTTIVKGTEATTDGQPLVLQSKELGSTENYPQTLSHSPNARFVAVCGDGTYTLYTSLAWRTQQFGSAQDFVWGGKDQNNDFAIRESSTSVKMFRKLKERPGGLDVGFQAEGLSGGVLLGVKGQGGIGMFDWETGSLVRRIEVEPREVYWSDSGELVALVCQDTTYILRFSREAYVDGLDTADEDGVEAAFEVVTDLNETIQTGTWVGDCFCFTNSALRLNYLIGDQTYTVAHFDKPLYLLGYLQRDGKLYLADRDMNVSAYSLPLTQVEFETLVTRGDVDTAMSLLPDIPSESHNKIARFLEAAGYKDLALQVATDPEHRFDLALSLSDFQTALEIAKTQDTEHKWKTLGDTAMQNWDLQTAVDCFTRAKDLGSLLLLYSSAGDKEGLKQLAAQAEDMGSNNIAFSAQFLATSGDDVDPCIDLLVRTERVTEAALFSQTYKPSRAPELVKLWKHKLEKGGKVKVARALGQPGDDGDEDLFPEWDEWIKIEKEGGGAGGKEEDLVDVNGVDGTNGEEDGVERGEEEEAETEEVAES